MLAKGDDPVPKVPRSAWLSAGAAAVCPLALLKAAGSGGLRETPGKGPRQRGAAAGREIRAASPQHAWMRQPRGDKEPLLDSAALGIFFPLR